MQKLVGMLLLVVGLGSVALAGPVAAPEIDGSTAVSALTLLSGAMLVIRGRKK
ncbi:MAG: hypothetical protein ACXVY9_07470 [Terriglobales bacterium]|jgi:hypothetical protein